MNNRIRICGYHCPIGWSTLALLFTACDGVGLGSGQAVSAKATVFQFTDNWLGKWNGPEGTFLQMDGKNGQYTLTIQNLDGARSFKAYASNHLVIFERDGVKESIRATNGIETGMKWLSEKTDCLTVRMGEGYCRD